MIHTFIEWSMITSSKESCNLYVAPLPLRIGVAQIIVVRSAMLDTTSKNSPH